MLVDDYEGDEERFLVDDLPFTPLLPSGVEVVGWTRERTPNGDLGHPVRRLTDNDWKGLCMGTVKAYAHRIGRIALELEEYSQDKSYTDETRALFAEMSRACRVAQEIAEPKSSEGAPFE